LTLHVIDGGISANNLDKLLLIGQHYRIKMHIIRPDLTLYNSLISSLDYVSKATFYRISIPELLDVEIEKAIYLDCDIIVKQDVVKIWETNVSNYHLAATVDYDTEKPKRPNDYKARFGIPRTGKYFNAGVLLLNLRRWRADHTSKKVLAYLTAHGATLPYADQDALNAVLHDSCCYLPPCWNQQPYVYRLAARETILDSNVIDLVHEPGIIHYLGRVKPWSSASSHPLRNEYYRYLALSPWKGYQPEDQTLTNYLTRANGLMQNKIRYLRYRSPFAQLLSASR
jgi:lipopolysaccharide biosynthesis glycosyltransferase